MIPKGYSEEDKQQLIDCAIIDPPPMGRDGVPFNNVYFYTDLENDNIPSRFYGINQDIAKKAFEIVEASL